MRNDNAPIIIEQKFKVPLNNVWEAITNPEQMKQWYFDNIPDFQPRVGFETNFLVTYKGREFPHQWKITQVIPGKIIESIWTFTGYTGASKVSFELFEQADGTLLRLTATILEPFPENIPEFKRESGVAGWTYFIKQRLNAYLSASNE